MNRSIEQSLLSLLPTHNAALPQPLTELASSLLAQSRHRASTLKAEEETARPYACAHLACERLKTALDLPPIDPRPPIPPRIYKRLFNHLDKILPAAGSTPSRTPGTPGGVLGSGRIRTPSSKLREQQLLATSPLASKSRGPPSRTTPSKDQSLSHFRNPTSSSATPLTDTPTKKRTTTTTPKPTAPTPAPPALPRWMRPTLRFLTTHLGPAPIGPVVAAGLESVLAPGGQPTGDAWARAHPVAVLGALYIFVWRGVTWPREGEEVDRERYVRFRREVAACLERARREVLVPSSSGAQAGSEEEDGWWDGWEGEVSVREFDVAAVRGSRRGWFDLEWVRGVEELAERERARQDGEREDGAAAAGEAVVMGLVGRPDSMFQERYDYLSERKRKAYAEWKVGILKRIKELEAR